jgi:Holliday junction resolvase RusA-like endonuclease
MKIILPGEFTDLNTYIRKIAYNRYAGGSVKKAETERVFWECKLQKIKPIAQYPVQIIFNWYIKNYKKDLDNIAFAKKFILDGLVMAKVLENDTQRFVGGFTDLFYLDKENPRTEIEIEIL